MEQKELPQHQQRVMEEKRDLDEKLGKLNRFFQTPTFGTLDPAERDRLRLQATAMTTYSEVLGDRISAF